MRKVVLAQLTPSTHAYVGRACREDGDEIDPKSTDRSLVDVSVCFLLALESIELRAV
jgi:hypothetical protein